MKKRRSVEKRLALAFAVIFATSAAVGVGSASAATEFGSGCAANKVTEGAVWVSTGHSPASPLPVTAPISGVITEWRVNSNLEVSAEGNLAGEFPRIFQPRLLVLRSAGPESFTVVGEAQGGPLTLKGSNTYLARVPVQAGDYLGIGGDPYALACVTEDQADTFGATVGGTPVGSTFKVELAKGLQVPVTARIEPDVDGDGYGDETQDHCPQSAAYQAPCPVVVVSSLSLAGTKAVSVYISTSLAAPITVTGIVKLAKGERVKLRAPIKTIAPGTMAHFRLSFTKRVRKALRALPVKRSLRLTIAASAPNLSVTRSIAKSVLKLPGQRREGRRPKAQGRQGGHRGQAPHGPGHQQKHRSA